jgi:hypothetical protein
VVDPSLAEKILGAVIVLGSAINPPSWSCTRTRRDSRPVDLMTARQLV